MNRVETAHGRNVPIWKASLSTLPVGVGVVAFLAIRWAWDVSALVLMTGIALLLSRFLRFAFRETLLLYAFAFLTLFVAAGVYLSTSVFQQWLPAPLLVAAGVLAALSAVAWIWQRSIRPSPNR